MKIFKLFILVFVIWLLFSAYEGYKTRTSAAILYSVVTNGFKKYTSSQHAASEKDFFNGALFVDPYSGSNTSFDYSVSGGDKNLEIEITRGPYFVRGLKILLKKNDSTGRWDCVGGSYVKEFKVSPCRAGEGIPDMNK